VEIRSFQSSDHDGVVQLWHAVFPDAPARNDQVRASSAEAVRFYERLGFQVEPRISMGKVLRPGGVAA
jgi:hypothetical protein